MFPMEEHNDLMLTLWYFVFDLRSRTLRYCTAGHHEALLMSPGDGGIAQLSGRGPAIGMLPAGRWTEGTATIPPGGRLYVFSDGAFEIVDATGAEWTQETLRAIVSAPAPFGTPEPGRIWHAIRQAARPGPLEDDVSIMVITFD